MHILLVNDDGIASEALHRLCRAAAARGHKVTVCAPAAQQSAKAHSFSINDPLRIKAANVEGADSAWAVYGTPADCTRMGLKAMCTSPVDLIISGVNLGYNTGLATYVSGTVGAAREGAFMGIPAMALSMEIGTPLETELFFDDWAIRVGEHLVGYGKRPPLSVCNINLPPVPVHQLKEPVICPISTKVYMDDYISYESPQGEVFFWPTSEFTDDNPPQGTDAGYTHSGHITCTFLTPEPCSQEQFSDFFDAL
ncbi:MAG: 5'/3'-nucleotidase SurE [Clostridia bacterium]|nr:5'/3'-nucleotidase SurE [Clostridia bacterium]